jgi:hypothetical protein
VNHGPVASLFRVRLEVLTEAEIEARPVATGQFSVHTLSIVACDGDVAVTAARRLVSEQTSCARLLSVEFVECIDSLATG